MPQGTLFLVPAPLDFGCTPEVPLTEVMPQATLITAARLRHWVGENAKTTRAYLKRINALVPLAQPLQEMSIVELPREVHKRGDHQGEFDARPLLAPALQGQDMGLVSEAGMPAIADPGASVVRAAHQLGVTVVPLVGPISLMLALAASGLNGQNFAFVGYLPQDSAERSARLRSLSQLVQQSGQTQLFIETPYRNAALFQALLSELPGQTRLAVCSGLSLPHQQVRCQTVQAWKNQPVPPDKNTPCVFLIGR
jgi:16S rRNA (cytidine1402-2'-O)-methyltransferase